MNPNMLQSITDAKIISPFSRFPAYAIPSPENMNEISNAIFISAIVDSPSNIVTCNIFHLNMIYTLSKLMFSK